MFRIIIFKKSRGTHHTSRNQVLFDLTPSKNTLKPAEILTGSRSTCRTLLRFIITTELPSVILKSELKFLAVSEMGILIFHTLALNIKD